MSWEVAAKRMTNRAILQHTMKLSWMCSGKKNTSLLFAKSYKNHQACEKDYKNWQAVSSGQCTERLLYLEQFNHATVSVPAR